MSDVTIIGGGIIGVCAAIALQDEGYSVEIIDTGDVRRGASYGNCSLLAIGEVVPISKPGVLAKIPKWILDPQGPLFVRPGALIAQMPWLLRFLLSGRAKRVEEIVAGLAPLTHRAEQDFRELLAKAGIPDTLVPAENLLVFNNQSDYESDRFTWDLRTRHGFDHTFLSGDEVRDLEPALGGPVRCGVLLKGWLQFSDPAVVVARLTDYFLSRNGTQITGSVETIETVGTKAVAVKLRGGERIDVKRLVLAAGAWSGRIGRDLGLRLPVAALQGYHHHLPNPNVKLGRPVLYANGGFVVTPLSSGLRIAGTIEISGLDPKPNFDRAEVIARKAAMLLPGLDLADGTRWMGPRPFMPDSTPVIGQAPRHDNVVLAFGHGQIGLTLGATTAKLVADLVGRRTPTIDLTPYRPGRF